MKAVVRVIAGTVKLFFNAMPTNHKSVNDFVSKISIITDFKSNHTIFVAIGAFPTRITNAFTSIITVTINTVFATFSFKK